MTTTAKAAATAILSAAATDKLIVSIKGRGKNLDKDIHQAALSVLDHHAKHGDVTLANRLLLAMPRSGRANALMAWMLAFGPKLAKNPAKDANAPLVHDKAGEGTFNVAEADATPFWEFKAVEGAKPFSFDAYMASLTKGMDKALLDPSLSDAQRNILATAKAALQAPTALVTPTTETV